MTGTDAHLAASCGSTLLEVAHGDDVAVVLEHVDGVFDALLVEVAGAGHLGVGEPEHVPTEAVHGCFGGQPGTGARLVEGGEQRLRGEQVPVLALLGVRP